MMMTRLIKKFFRFLLLKFRIRNIKGAVLKSLDTSSDIRIDEFVQIPKKCHIRKNVSIGRATYISPNTTIESNVSIGKYCSLAPGVFIAPGEHYTDLMTTHPVLFDPVWRKKFGIHEKEEYIKKIGKSDINTIIGNDVWIGLNVIIMRGVKIGDGAIIAAGAVVTKDVPPYAIVGGVPAKVIRFRFNKETIHRLLNDEWWNKELDIERMIQVGEKKK